MKAHPKEDILPNATAQTQEVYFLPVKMPESFSSCNLLNEFPVGSETIYPVYILQ
jgi:hypothetical protein